ncbi:MAG: hypothetical protein JW814_07175 [Candidatus Krumholzibacteriota bacterium]|nr:hypothetical protein [Candidatus Krumholzibacteriota bacterium]
MKKSILLVSIAVLFLSGTLSAGKLPFPVSISAKGGIGTASFSMSEINSQITYLRQVYNTNLSPIDNGFQVYLDGRIWVFDRIAFLVGYEHYWVDSSMDATTFTLMYKCPANVYMMGGAVNVVKFPKLLDINVGARGTYTKAIYGSNEVTESTRLLEYKQNNYGWDLFAEATTNFLNPVEVGLMFGYRNAKITEMENKFKDIATHAETGEIVTLNYSGVFFYLTAGFRLW